MLKDRVFGCKSFSVLDPDENLTFCSHTDGKSYVFSVLAIENACSTVEYVSSKLKLMGTSEISNRTSGGYTYGTSLFSRV